ncbi:acetyl-CoA carboxylase biotin carboxyl carrier protein [candidate division WOR-3 bacterium]|nr:acetyl-CoA carboxylase biotin carboxyl carrier protein [candidate division WOR-3 bacterium]
MKIKEIEKIVRLLENSIVCEIELSDFWGRKIKISKAGNDAHRMKTGGRPAEERESGAVETEKAERKNLTAIRSPIVGTFYRAPAPDAPPYVEIGDILNPGQVVCIVEAMKLMNEIESDVAGRVVQILVKNENPVEYNQELMLIEPL